MLKWVGFEVGWVLRGSVVYCGGRRGNVEWWWSVVVVCCGLVCSCGVLRSGVVVWCSSVLCCRVLRYGCVCCGVECCGKWL